MICPNKGSKIKVTAKNINMPKAIKARMIATTRDKWIVPCPTVILENIFDTGYRANARPIAKRIGNRNVASSYKIKDTPAATANL